jgi:molybdenum transport protein
MKAGAASKTAARLDTAPLSMDRRCRMGAVACTSKNVPGTKRFAVAVVKAGGAVMHRLGLSETVLVFPEHCAFLGREPFVGLVEKLRRAAPEKPGAFMQATSPLMRKPERMSWSPHRPIWRSRVMCM